MWFGFSITNQIRRAKRRISDINNVNKRQHLIVDEQRRFARLRAERQEKIERKERQIADLDATAVERSDNESRVAKLRRLALILLTVDVGVQSLLWRVGLGPMSLFLLVPLGLVSAFGGGAIVGLACYVLFFDADRIERTRRICYILAGIAGFVAVGGGILLAFARTATGAAVPYILGLLSPSLWAIGEGLPVCAGCLAAAAYALDHHNEIRRDRDCLAREIAEIDEFVSWLGEERKRLEPPIDPGLTSISTPSKSTPPAAAPPVLVKPLVVAVIAGILGTGLLFTCQTAQAQIAPIPVSTAAAKPVAPLIIISPCIDEELDATSSVNRIFRARAVRDLSAITPEIAGELHCTQVDIGNFSDEGPWAPSVRLQVPRQAAPTCPVGSTGNKGLSGLLATFWVAGRNYIASQAEQRCAAALRAKEIAQATAKANFEKRLKIAFATGVIPRGTCTDIYRTVARDIAERPHLVLVATDAAQTCSANLAVLPHPGTEVVMLLLPSTGPLGKTGPEAIARAKKWQAVILGLQIIYPEQLGSSAWLAPAGLGGNAMR